MKVSNENINPKDVIVTEHAIEQFKRRSIYQLNSMFRYESEEDIIEFLRNIFLNGMPYEDRPKGHVYHWRDVLVVVAPKKEGRRMKYIIVTCLGDEKYYKWAKTQKGNRKHTY